MAVAKRRSKRRTRRRSSAGGFRSLLDRGPFRFVRDTYGELRRSHWPSQQETTRLTLIVLGVCLLLAAILGTFDFGLSRLSELIFG
ncbi:MAG: preprotein translocase subunit SecE [Chloroflexi bacterium]|nr:preprotein translocase subunit SecE [Chloroflexota bacterium]